MVKYMIRSILHLPYLGMFAALMIHGRSTKQMQATCCPEGACPDGPCDAFMMRWLSAEVFFFFMAFTNFIDEVGLLVQSSV